MKRALISIALCAASAWASAQTDQTSETPARSAWLPSAIGLHLGTRHDVRGPQQPGDLGCVQQLLKPTPAPLLSAGVFWQPSPSHPLTLGLQRLPESGTTGSAAWTLSIDWRF